MTRSGESLAVRLRQTRGLAPGMELAKNEELGTNMELGAGTEHATNMEGTA
jgi:hypothetical protein